VSELTNPVPREWLELGLAGLGAAAKATIEDWVAKQFPTFPTEYAGIIAGFLIYRYGDRLHEYLKSFGAGVLIGSIGQLDIVKGLIPKAGSSSSSQREGKEQQALTVGDLARVESERTVVRGVL